VHRGVCIASSLAETSPSALLFGVAAQLGFLVSRTAPAVRLTASEWQIGLDHGPAATRKLGLFVPAESGAELELFPGTRVEIPPGGAVLFPATHVFRVVRGSFNATWAHGDTPFQ